MDWQLFADGGSELRGSEEPQKYTRVSLTRGRNDFGQRAGAATVR